VSGHNKWSKIKHKKAVEDAKKSKAFSKFSHLITYEAKRADGNRDAPALRAVIERARAVNMPSTNIERAIKKGGDKDVNSLEEVMYEAYGPGGSALIIDVLTNNKNRILSEVKQILLKNGASFAERGAASWAFNKKGGEWTPKTTVPLPEKDSKTLKQLMTELEDNDDVQTVYTNVN